MSADPGVLHTIKIPKAFSARIVSMNWLHRRGKSRHFGSKLDDSGKIPPAPARTGKPKADRAPTPSQGRQLYYRFAVILGIGILVGLLAVISQRFFEGPGRIVVFWPANAVVFGVIFAASSPARAQDIWALIGAAFIGNITANLTTGDPLLMALPLALSNTLEIASGTWLAWYLPGPQPQINQVAGIIKLAAITSLAAPALGALTAATSLNLLHHDQFCPAYLTWFAADALGNALFIPIVTSLTIQGPASVVPTRKLSFFALAISLTAFALIFNQSSILPLFLASPLLLPVVLTAGLIGTTIALAFVSVIAVIFTLTGHGPMWVLAPYHPDLRIFLLQGFLVTALITAIPVAFALDARKLLISKLDAQKHKLSQSEAHYRSLAELSSDIILISNANGRIAYLSPAIERVLGFKPEQAIGFNTRKFVHPDDQAMLADVMKKLGGDIREVSAELRVRHQGGHYVWLEDRVRIGHRAAGGELEFISVLRDISIRRAQEEQRMADLARLDTLANTDPLTGLANRRRFADQLDQEWQRAIRENAPIALLSLDADHFKSFNDRYGHPAGDSALQTIAEAMGRETLRSADLVARIGGEEFAAILPGTSLEGALKVAERMRNAITQIGIQHEDSETGYLSVSIGVAAVIPERDQLSYSLIEAADRALYAAKDGRDRVAS